jgi:hypothetical protein
MLRVRVEAEARTLTVTIEDNECRAHRGAITNNTRALQTSATTSSVVEEIDVVSLSYRARDTGAEQVKEAIFHKIDYDN